LLLLLEKLLILDSVAYSLFFAGAKRLFFEENKLFTAT